MSYQMRVDPRSRNSGRFSLRVQRELQKAVSSSGMRQQQIAEKLGVDRSIINRRLTGRANLTLRSIADIAWATDHDVVISLKPKTVIVKSNEHPTDSFFGYHHSETYSGTPRGVTTPVVVSPSVESSKNRFVIQHEGA